MKFPLFLILLINWLEFILRQGWYDSSYRELPEMLFECHKQMIVQPMTSAAKWSPTGMWFLAQKNTISTLTTKPTDLAGGFLSHRGPPKSSISRWIFHDFSLSNFGYPHSSENHRIFVIKHRFSPRSLKRAVGVPGIHRAPGRRMMLNIERYLFSNFSIIWYPHFKPTIFGYPHFWKHPY